jgi:predicted nucleotidyltransferase
MELPETVRKQLVTALQEDNRIAAAYLLGSAAHSSMRADSDFDIAVLPFPSIKLSSLDLATIAGALSYELGRQVDMGLLSSANLLYARQVLGSGIRLFSKDPYYVDLMETSLISMYLWFNEERKELVHAYTN